MKNALEGAVRAIFLPLRREDAGFCTCQRCEDDVVALALNQIRPRYVAGGGTFGEVITGVELSYDQMRAELTVLVLDAMRRVAANPHHGAPPPPLRDLARRPPSQDHREPDLPR